MSRYKTFTAPGDLFPADLNGIQDWIDARVATFETAGASNIPTASQKAALAGTSGSPSGTNKYLTDSDARNSNARTPVAHASSHKSGGGDVIRLDELALPTTSVSMNSQALINLRVPSLSSEPVRNDDSRLSDSRAPSGSAGGDLGNSSYPNPLVEKFTGWAPQSGTQSVSGATTKTLTLPVSFAGNEPGAYLLAVSMFSAEILRNSLFVVLSPNWNVDCGWNQLATDVWTTDNTLYPAANSSILLANQGGGNLGASSAGPGVSSGATGHNVEIHYTFGSFTPSGSPVIGWSLLPIGQLGI